MDAIDIEFARRAEMALIDAQHRRARISAEEGVTLGHVCLACEKSHIELPISSYTCQSWALLCELLCEK